MRLCVHVCALNLPTWYFPVSHFVLSPQFEYTQLAASGRTCFCVNGQRVSTKIAVSRVGATNAVDFEITVW